MAALLGLVPLVQGGCAGGQGGSAEPTADMRAQGRAVFSDDPAAPRDPGDDGRPGSRAPHAPASDASWTIVLARPLSADQQAATELLHNIQTVGGEPSARLATRRGKPLIAYGRYPSPDDPRAKQDLERLRSKLVDGRSIFAHAFLTPPPDEALRGTRPEWDLRTVRQRRGEDAMYTLQIGVYTRLDGRAPSADDLAQFRTAAEQAVAQLRAEGEQAFYHHGPGASTITVGVFGPNDHDPGGGGFDSPRLADARERHPHNLVNGQGYYEMLRTDTGKTVRRLQRSQLVAIPD